MSYKKREISKKELEKKFTLSEGKLNFNYYHTIISDWSGIFIEFSKITSSKCILLNMPKKKLNQEFNFISSIPIEISSRKILGYEIDVDNFNQLNQLIEKIILEKNNYTNEVKNFFKKNFY